MDKMLELEYQPGEELVVRFRPPRLPQVSPEAREHFQAARKEALLALRSLIDAAIATTEKAPPEGEGKKKRTKVDVQ